MLNLMSRTTYGLSMCLKKQSKPEPRNFQTILSKSWYSRTVTMMTVNSSYDQLGSWVISTAEATGGVNNLDDIDIYVKAKDLGLEAKHKTLTVLAQTIFDDSIVEQIPKRASMLKKLITSERHEKAFLGGTERFVGKEHPKLVPQVPQILMACYQEDLITEAVLKNWGSKASKKYVDLATSKKVRQAAQPFLGWLENAESDEEEEEEEEEEA